MARRQRKAKGSKRSIDFSNVGKSFEKDKDYHLVVKAAEWKDGNEHPYIAIEFCGKDKEYENSTIYHNASMAPKALSRTRELLEALEFDIGDGEVEIDTEELVGLEVMATTYEDKYDGGKSIKVDEFWPVEGGGKSSDSGSSDSIDFDELDDDDIKKLGKKLKIKAKKVDDIREALADEDEDDVRKAAEALDIDLGGEAEDDGKDAGGDDDGEIDFDELSDAQVKKLGKALKIKSKDADEIREALADQDADDVKSAAEDLDIELPTKEEDEPEPPKGKAGKASKGGSKKSGSKKYSEDAISEMSEEELEEVIEKTKIDVDLDDHKTLRKKKNAVIDALTEADLIED